MQGWKKPAIIIMTTVLPTTIALLLPMEAALVGKVQRGVERVRICVVFLPDEGYFILNFPLLIYLHTIRLRQ
jgi:hypothetical protein